MAANTFLRSLFAAAFPLVAQPLYHNLGTDYACTLLGCIAAVLALVPFVLYSKSERSLIAAAVRPLGLTDCRITRIWP